MRGLSLCLCGQTWENLDVTKYFKNPSGNGILRIANHHGSANEFAIRDEWTGNYGIVFLFKGTAKKFRVDGRVDYKEEVYFP